MSFEVTRSGKKKDLFMQSKNMFFMQLAGARPCGRKGTALTSTAAAAQPNDNAT